MSRRAMAVVALMLAMPLTGCFGGDADEDEPQGPEPGVVAGRVLEDVGTPVADATVRILLTNHTQTTGQDGSFRFAEVAPGPVVVVAAKDGFSSQTLRGNLNEGGSVDLEFELTQAPTVAPRDETLIFEDEVPCGLPAGLGCGPAAEGDLPRHHFEVSPGLREMVYELTWTPPATGTATSLRVDAAAATDAACGETYASATGESVLRLESAEGFPIAGGHQCALVFPGDDATAQQAYTLYVTLFYYGEAPDGFTAVP